ncbi:MAG: P-loop NTPase [Clostridiaceae bacterium]|nr:P-loop NTPase [Clostridiaceae bacterium]
MDKNKITVELHSLVRDLIRNIWVIILSALIGLMGIYIASYSVYSPEYTSSATLVVTAKGSAQGGNLSMVSVYSEMADVYTNVFVQQLMKTKAAEKAGFSSFDGDISATVLAETNLIELSVTSRNPQTAYKLLKAVLEVYPEISDNIFENSSIGVIKQPSMPFSPSNRITTANKKIIMLVCIAVSAAAIIVISLLRDTVKNEDAFLTKIDSKLLGSVVHESKRLTFQDYMKKKKKALLIYNNAFIGLKFAESFQKIAAKLEQMKSHGGDKVFAITSVSENEGKSTVAANLALSLASRGYRVVLFDLDAKKPALYKIFEQNYEKYYELGELMNREIKYSEFRLRKFKKTSLYLALNTKPYADSHRWIENGKVEKIISATKEKADFVIIDTAPMTVDSSVTDIAKLSDKTLLVVRTDTVTVSDINDAIITIGEVGGNMGGCILNDVYPEIKLKNVNGADESGNYYGKNYGKYGKYGKKAGKYEKYGRYSYFPETSDGDENAAED